MVEVRRFNSAAELDEAVKVEGKLAFVDIPFEEYRRTNAVSQSSLQRMKMSPSKFKWELDHPRPSSEAQVLGTAIHCALLEPEKFNSLYCPKPKFDRRTKVGKEGADEWDQKNLGKIGLQQDLWDVVERVVARATDSEFFMQFFSEGLKEISFFAQHPAVDLVVRGRIDNYIPDKNVIVDLKTTDCAQESVFNRDIREYGYDLQAAYYMDLVYLTTGVMPTAYVIVAIEKSKDCDMNVFTFSNEYLARVSNLNQQYLHTLAKCVKSNTWPGYEQKFISYVPPEYFNRQLDNFF
jgi:hypothetical protein